MILSSVRNPDNANIMALTQKVYQSPKYPTGQFWLVIFLKLYEKYGSCSNKDKLVIKECRFRG